MSDNSTRSSGKVEYDLHQAFHFSVSINGEDIAFSEVSGLSKELTVEEVKDGFVSRNSYRLPSPVKYGNLILKRALSAAPSDFMNWITNCIDSLDIELRDIIVSLVGYDGNIVKTWNIFGAYPIKMNVTNFDAKKDEIVIETIEFAYKGFIVG